MVKRSERNGDVPPPLANLVTLVPQDSASAARWPNLYACLMPHWIDGKCTRQAGSLKVKLVGSWFVVTLSCPQEGVDTDLTTETLIDLFDQFEAHLAAGKAVWKPDWNSTKKSRQKKGQ